MSKNLKTIGTLRERERERATLLNNGNDIASDFCVVHKSVGAASSCPQGKGICTIYRGTNGITLIALIVTIIVLLILAMTSVSLVLRYNLIKKAQLAKDEYEQAAQTELEELLELESELGSYGLTNSGSESEDLKKLQKYFTETQWLNETNGGFNDNDVIEDASESIEMFFYDDGYSWAYASRIWIEYNNNAYVLNMDDNSNVESVEEEFTTTEKMGTTIPFSYDGTTETDWIILYEGSDYYEIISPTTLGSVTIGTKDESAEGETDLDKTINSYNGAIAKINQYCDDIVTNRENVISVRSAGSNPQNPSSEGEYINYTAEYNGNQVEKQIRQTDENARQDVLRMYFFEIQGGNNYWLASRNLNVGNGWLNGHMQVEPGSVGNIFDVQRSAWQIYDTARTAGVRPIVKIKK